jgi:hypothetical protein
MEGNVISSQTSRFTTTATSARARLYAVGGQIATDNFPLGAGFGRFASYPSRLHYSPVYEQYGLSSVWGLSRVFPSFIDDTSWPSVIGETGYAGLAAYAFGLVILLLTIVRRLRTVEREMKWVPLAAICTLGVIVIDSLGDPTLFAWVPTISFALILGPAVIGTRPTHTVPLEEHSVR